VAFNGATYTQDATAFGSVLGQVTGVKVRTLEDRSTWLYTINYYDDKYRIIQSVSDNLKGGADRVTNLYDFTGKVLATKNNHTTGKVTWQNIVAATVDGDNLIKTGTSATWGTSGASSAERIPAGVEGWVEITMSEVGSRRMVGLSPDDADQNTTSIKYGFYLDLATLRMQVNGSTVSVTYPLAIGDRLRIAREGGLISFYKNGIKIYPLTISQQISSTESLLVDVAMHSYQATVSRTRLSAGQESPKTVTRRFDYDHAGRLTKTWHKLNTGAQILLAQNEYNELGQLVNKRLDSSDAISTPRRTTYLQAECGLPLQHPGLAIIDQQFIPHVYRR